MCETRISSLWGKITVFVVICCLVLACVCVNTAVALDGSGTQEDPWRIQSLADFDEFAADANYWDDYTRLETDINLAGRICSTAVIAPDTNDTKFGFQGTWFTGVFDGNDHTISNFTYDSNDRDYIGLFGYVDDSQIKNLGIVDVNVVAGMGDSISLLAGANNGTISNCYSTGSVTGGQNVGGLVGWNWGTITKCYSEGSVKGEYYSHDLGGLVGWNWGSITKCYSTSSVGGHWKVGGLCGTNWYFGSISNCYTTGSVSGDNELGGLCGTNSGIVYLSFWDIETSGIISSAGGVGKITAEMMDINTYAGWGDNIWTVDSGNDYPHLIWENKTGVPIIDPVRTYSGGAGTIGEPYLIAEPNDLFELGCYSADWDKHFNLSNDIDLSGFVFDTHLIPIFYGVFDGANHKLLNLTIDTAGASNNNLGLFGQIRGEQAQVLNLGLENVSVNGGNVSSYLGGLCGINYSTISHCYATGTINGRSSIGGLAGFNIGVIRNCYTTCSVSGDYRLGGLCGSNYSTISNCYSTGSVVGDSDVGGLIGFNDGIISKCSANNSVTGTKYIGGLCGRNYSFGTITDCYSEGSVLADDQVGGLVGCSSGTITKCYSTDSVTGYGTIGGLVGYSNGTITKCYSTGSVEGITGMGGLAGSNGGIISNCYTTGNVSGDRFVGGLCGWNYGIIHISFWDIETSGILSSAGGVGKTTAEMMDIDTFAGWGDNIWNIDNGNDYPHLIWENQTGIPIIDPVRTYSGGAGTIREPYLIAEPNDLYELGFYSADWDKHFNLSNDIDLSDFVFDTYLIPVFYGVFDGTNHKLLNLTIDTAGASKNNLGLFGQIRGEQAQVLNLGLENVSVNGGNVSSYLGGLCGINYSTISHCYATGTINGRSSIGGLAGFNIGVIRNCYTTCSVSGDYRLGGLCGSNYSTISNCYSTGSVVGDSDVGGLVGYNQDGSVSNCYSTGNVSGDWDVGGLVGYDYSGVYTCSFWDNTVNPLLTGIGNAVDPNVIGESTANMQTQSTFTDAGWDFVGETVNGIEDIWFIPQQDYPHLWWEGMRVPMKLTPRTLNCRSKGNWVKAHITLPEGYTVADVDSNRPAVLHSFGFQSAPLHVSVNKNEQVEIKAAFEREAVCSLAGDWPEALTVAGFLADGNIFLGTSTVRMIAPGMKVIEELASCWLQGDCVHPTWCDGIDMNRDSLVNLLDYALLMNIEVEFVNDE